MSSWSSASRSALATTSGSKWRSETAFCAGIQMKAVSRGACSAGGRGSTGRRSEKSKALRTVRVFCSYGDDRGSVVLPGDQVEESESGGGNGRFIGGDGGDDDDGGGAGDNNDGGDSEEDREFGVLLNWEQVAKELEIRGGFVLPSDMAEAARTTGIRELLLARYIELQNGPLGGFVRSNAMLRNRLLADPAFLFKVVTEIAIDSGCATFAEVQKRGKDFWNEFELYLSDLGVGIVLDIALVGMLAPYVSFGKAASGGGSRARLSRAIQALPSSIFEAARPGRAFSVEQRGMAFVYKAVQYGISGFSCGIVGQGIASSIMTLKRKLRPAGEQHEEEVAVPSIFKSAALWGVFMAVSSNTRYQIINGLERVVESSPVSRRVPPVALAFTVGIRFANNIYGGMQFVDWARLAGVQ